MGRASRALLAAAAAWGELNVRAKVGGGRYRWVVDEHSWESPFVGAGASEPRRDLYGAAFFRRLLLYSTSKQIINHQN